MARNQPDNRSTWALPWRSPVQPAGVEALPILARQGLPRPGVFSSASRLQGRAATQELGSRPTADPRPGAPGASLRQATRPRSGDSGRIKRQRPPTKLRPETGDSNKY